MVVSCNQCRSHDGNDFETTCCFRGVFRGGKIAALLHDVGALQGKAGHALRGKQFAEAYFVSKDLFALSRRNFIFYRKS